MARLLATAALVLGLLLPGTALAGDPPTLGATLDTAGTWVAVTSRATVPAHVELSSEGDVTLARTSFDIDPGGRVQVAYTGSGKGWVTARMTPIGVDGAYGAVELRAWVVYVAPPIVVPPPLWPLGLLALGLLASVFMRVRRIRRIDRLRQRIGAA